MELSGGQNIEPYLKSLLDKLGGSGLHVRVGFLEGSTCGHDNSAPAPEVAFWNEYGTPGSAHPIPARPFFRTMIAERSPSWGRLIAAALKHADNDATKALQIIGEKIKGQLQTQITNTTEPPNSPATVAGKGFNKPLEDSKNMKRSVSFQVTGKPTEGGD